MASYELKIPFDEAVNHLVTKGIVFVQAVRDDPDLGSDDIYIVNLKLFISIGSGLTPTFFNQYMTDLKSYMAGLPHLAEHQQWVSMEPNSYQLDARRHILGI